MRDVEEVDLLGSGDFIWHVFDPQVKADLFSTGLLTPAGTYLIDVIPLAQSALVSAVAASRIAGIVVTNANHVRDAAALARRLSVGVYARAAAAAEIPDAAVIEIDVGDDAGIPGVETIAIDGGAAGEIALFRADASGGTLVIGDAVINSGSYGFTLLPPKYCADAKLLRKSLGQLLDYTFERMLFAHGAPILSRARSRLAELLDAS